MASSELEPLAIVGIGCKLPGGASSAQEFWSVLKDGRCGIGSVPGDRWSLDRFYDKNKGALGKASTHWGGFVSNVRDFDAEFFGISPREAEAMDPQQRLLLIATWRAFEDAGIPIDRLRGSNTAVYVGVSSTDYMVIQRFRRTGENMHAGPGGAMSIAANRISHKFDFRGPSVSVDTACSSSLVATDLACQAIWSGKSDMAVAAGVNVLLDPGVFINFSKANMMSPTGRIRTFDANADGYVRGEGVGVVVLKRLSQALLDHDRVYAVVRGTCVNQDGNTSTITIPSAEAQTEMLLTAARSAGLRAEDIDYVEAHGTGTPVGDPIEANAIGRAFGLNGNRKRALVLGAGKTNTGHLESAAGITGLIKTSLALYHREIPRNINFKSLNPNIPLDDLGLVLPLEHMSWVADEGRPRRGAVNSFGFGGTNACAVLEEAPRDRVRSNGAMPAAKTWFLPIGAQTEVKLKQTAHEIADVIEAAGPENAPKVYANLALRRAHMTFRAGAIARTADEAVEALRNIAKDKAAAKDHGAQYISGKKLDQPKLVMAFAGQGGTWWGMAHELLANDPIFRKAVEEVDAIHQPLAGWSVMQELLRGDSDYRESTVYSVPCLFALQVGLAARWASLGVKPDLVIGHSSGEMAASYVAGILNLEDAVRLTFERGRLQGLVEGRGKIAAIALTRAEVEATLAEYGITRLDIAGVNGPEMVNLAGDTDALEFAIEKLKEKHGQDLFARILRMTFAAHSHHMDDFRDELFECLATLRPQAAHTPMISTVTGRMLIGPMADASYWWRNVRDPVLFDAGVREVIRSGGNVFLEIGPHLNLSAMISPIVADKGGAMPVITSLKRGEPSEDTLMTATGQLYAAGIEPNWHAMYGDTVERMPLPEYPFDMKPFWIESEETQHALFGPNSHPLLGFRMLTPQPSWSNELSLDEHTYLNGHVIDGSVIFPGAGYVEIMFAAARETLGEGVIEVQNIEILEAMVLSNERSEMLFTEFEPVRNRVSIYSRQRGSNLDWSLRARGIVRIITGLTPPPKRKIKLPAKGATSGRQMYADIAKRGYAYGDHFDDVQTIYTGETESIAVLSTGPTEKYFFHPGRFDSAIHANFGLDNLRRGSGDRMYLPVRIERAVLYAKAPKGQLISQCRSVSFDETQSVVDMQVDSADGDAVLTLEGFTMRALSIGTRQKKRDVDKPTFVSEEWVETELKTSKRNQPLKGQSWIALCSKGASALSQRAASALSAAGADVVVVTPSSNGRASKDGQWTVDPSDPQSFTNLIAALKSAGEIPKSGPRAILFGWPLDLSPPEGEYNLAALRSNETLSTIALMHLGQTYDQAKTRPRVWVMTRGVTMVEGETADENRILDALLRGPISGMTRPYASEYSHHDIALIDLDSDTKSARDQLAQLPAIFAGQSDETEIALRGEKAYVPRLRMEEAGALPPLPAPARQPGVERFHRLAMTRPGDLDNLYFAEITRQPLGKNQVRVEIKAGGLNFRDVMAATALLPADAESGIPTDNLGLESSGLVIEVGPGVRTIKPGDRVMTTAKGCFRSEAIVDVGAVHILPKSLNYIEAATVPTAFATAYYGLVHLARVRPGERVLVHLGTGGVGLAAIQIAKMKGAEVISTAGSADKRAYLSKLGVKHVFDSRALDFAQRVRDVTDGRGVDIVLNALAGDAIPMGISLLAPNGRFIEIGKRDIYGDSAIGLRAFRHNVTFFALDMARMDHDDPKSLAAVYAEVLGHFAAGRLKPLPALTFKASKVRDAFKAMAQAKHIGKVVIDFDDADLVVGLSNKLPLALDPKAAYVIVGGLGGFGAEVAKFFAVRGARHLYLVGRSGADRPEAKALLKQLTEMGVKAHAVAADISKPGVAAELVAKIAKSGIALKGMVHSAMVLDDGYVRQLNSERMLRVLEPKVLGAWNMHLATVKSKLDFFIMFSSMAATIGSMGQANYVAANRTLDFLAAHRRRMNLPALAINWGALGGAGAVQKNKALQKYLKEMGMPALPLADTLAGLETAMRVDTAQLGSCIIDWKLVARTNSNVTQIPRFSEVVSTETQAVGGGRIRTDLLNAKGADRDSLLKDYIAKQIARVLKIDAKQLVATRPLNELGLDSLTSFQLKNKIEGDVGITLPVGKFLQKPTIESLGAIIGQVLEASAQSARKGAASGAAKSSGPVMSERQRWLWKRIQSDGTFPVHGSTELLYALEVSLPIDAANLNKAFKGVVQANEALRSVFPATNGEPRVALLTLDKFKVADVDTRNESDSVFMERMDLVANTPHNLETGPLIDLTLYRRPAGRNVLVLRGQGIVMDGWSFGSVLRDVFQGYFGMKTATNGEEATSFYKFAAEGNEWVQSAKGKESRAFWREKLRNLPAPLQIGKKPSSINPAAGGRFVKRYLASTEGFDVRGAARRLGVSLNALLAGAYQAHLHAHTGATDIVLVTTAANRLTLEQESVVGAFSNYLFVRTPVDASNSFRAHCEIAAQAFMEPLDHAAYPVHLMLEAAAESNSGPIAPHFLGFNVLWPDNSERNGFEGVMFAPPGTMHRFGGFEMRLLPAAAKSAGHFLNDAAITYQELDGELYLSLRTRDGVFNKGEDEAFLDAYIRMIEACVRSPELTLAELAASVARRDAAE